VGGWGWGGVLGGGGGGFLWGKGVSESEQGGPPERRVLRGERANLFHYHRGKGTAIHRHGEEEGGASPNLRAEKDEGGVPQFQKKPSRPYLSGRAPVRAFHIKRDD